ncbi:hypothetical protein ACKVWC_011573 [Pyricularia oryzae]
MDMLLSLMWHNRTESASGLVKLSLFRYLVSIKKRDKLSIAFVVSSHTILSTMPRSSCQFKCLLGHGHGTLESLVTSNEARSVDKHTTRDTGNLVKLLVPKTPPGLGQGQPALERVLGDGHTLDPPLGVGRRLLRVQDIHHLTRAGVLLLEGVKVVVPRNGLALENEDAALTGRVVLGPVREGVGDNRAGRQPGACVVVQVAVELLTDSGAGGLKALVLSRLGLGGVLRDRVVPVRVQAADDGAEREAAVREALLQRLAVARRRQYGRVVG